MSYDLYFCSGEPRELLFSEVVDWSRKYDFFKQSGDTQLFYENEDTGVYFVVEYSRPAEGDDLDIPSGVFNTGLSFNLNYARPTFFGLESMPIVEELARCFGLLMYDPQGSPEVGTFDSKKLFESWAKSNRSAVRVMTEQGATNLCHFSSEQAMRFWNYMREYRQLTSELSTEDVFVPRQVLIAPKDSQEVGTAIVWTQGIHLVVPRTDWIFVMYPKRFWRRQNKVVCFSSETVLTHMQPYLRDYDTRRSLRILPPEYVTKADKVLNGLTGGFEKCDVTRRAPGDCVNVPFGRFVSA